MQTQEGKKWLSAETVIGLYAVIFSLMGVLSVIYAMKHTGFSGLFGWVGVVAANAAVFSTSRYKEMKKRFVEGQKYFLGPIFMLVIMAIMITDMAGVWDAR